MTLPPRIVRRLAALAPMALAAALVVLCPARPAAAQPAPRDIAAAGPASTAASQPPRDIAAAGPASTAASQPPRDIAAAGVDRPPAADPIAQVRANFTPENRSYWRTRVLLSLLFPAWTIAVALVLLATGAAARLRDLAHARFRGRYARFLAFVVLFSAVIFVVDLPLSWFSGFWLEHRYGLSNLTFMGWLKEQAIGLAVNVVLLGVVPILMLAYLAVEKSPQRWWLWLALGTLPLIVGITLIAPIVIDPLTNKYEPLRDQALKERILALAARADIPARKVFQVDKSRQTRKLNAYVTGFGESQRIVLWDTILEAMDDDEILFVMGHEMGHYKLAHIWKGILFYSVVSFGLIYVVFRGTRWAVRRFGERWGFRELSDPASLPLFVIAATVLTVAFQPIDSGFSRLVEREADVFGLEATRLNEAAAQAFIKLGAHNKANPEPPRWIEIYQYSHPPLVERIRFALGYRPWEEGKPNRRFRPGS